MKMSLANRMELDSLRRFEHQMRQLAAHGPQPGIGWPTSAPEGNRMAEKQADARWLLRQAGLGDEETIAQMVRTASRNPGVGVATALPAGGEVTLTFLGPGFEVVIQPRGTPGRKPK